MRKSFDLDEDIQMSPCNWYEEFLSDIELSTNENDSTFDCENDIPDLTKNKIFTGKLIKNAIETEKTFTRLYNQSIALSPTKE